VTIKDIAKLSGVSVSTVSRVLNNKPDVSQTNRDRVLRVIEKNKYIPNNSARDLVRTSSDGVGVVARGISNPFYTNIIRAMEDSLAEAGYTMVLQQIGSCDDEVQRGAVMEREKRLRGIVFLGGRSDYSADELAVLNVPFVCCSYSNQYGTLALSEYSSVSIEDEEEAYRAVRYLYEHGHRRIAALVSATDDRSISQLRYQGYVRALSDCGIALDEGLVIRAGSFNTGDAYLAMQAQLQENDDFTAVFSIADNMAIGAMRALREHGRGTPDDCSVIAIDGLEISAYIDPPLTTLCQPMEQLGRRSVEILVDMMEHHNAHRQEILQTELREGASVRNIQ
jgi:LacI family transcriptional regulator